ncbi:insulin-like growth factor 1 receptor isoform X2 [Trichoplusia ni]|uniref:receptor protein-tyrosine kinase n=1 Tax=Trichoplusia ni TaxID=7111 RepID=A0A7E5VRC6_TRINI|nr:insulin-like growth factor 1 receptor isoform X2 [Trichoplusia ni]
MPVFYTVYYVAFQNLFERRMFVCVSLSHSLVVAGLLIYLLSGVTCQRLDLTYPNRTGICKGGLFTSIPHLRDLDGCVVIIGSLEIFIERSEVEGFRNVTFRELREITEYLVIYRVRGLKSVGNLFPNLTRIRGAKLLNNFALIVYDNGNLIEIGLYRLLKIDRGGVTMWSLPQACFVDTIDWKVLAPRYRHVISPPDVKTACNVACSCTRNVSTNHCWNNMKCQLYLEGPEADKCNDQCLGCRKTNKDVCFVCRHYTYRGKCVAECPPDSILLPDSQYCITEEECLEIDRWVWNNTCVSQCPVDYIEKYETHDNITRVVSCKPCTHCEITCGNLRIQSLSSIQNAERCVYVKGYLIIHVRSIPGAISDLKTYLGQIEEVSQYVAIEGSDITSLDFLSSLRTIKGEKLRDDQYSLDVNYNYNLQSLFTDNVLKNLQIKKGSARFENNPVLCMSKIDEIISRLPIAPTPIDIPEGSNGYKGACKEVAFQFNITTTSESSVLITFSPVLDHNIHYSALYVRLPPGVHTTVVPETCSEFEWHATDVPTDDKNYGVVELKSLHPASTYALCIEIYHPEKRRLMRSNIFNFTTPVGIPEPPFIVELVASSSDVVVLHWVDHKYYLSHIDRYELDVVMIEMNSRESPAVDYCKSKEDNLDVDYTEHAVVRRPPPEYARGCESMCGVLSTVTLGAMVEEYFDVCDDSIFMCNNEESIISTNSTYGNYVRTLVLNISSPKPKNGFQVGGLAPYSDYKFRLRACSGNHCSRSAKGVVRTFSLKNADIPTITYTHANQFGHIFLKWNPPNVTNGPILAYSIEVMPRNNINNLMPQTWCVLAEETRTFVQSVIIPIYLVRVCAKTLASSKSCSDWTKITVDNKSKMVMLWTGVVCGILIYIGSCAVGWLKRRLRHRSDVVPLVDSSSSSRVESDPPGLILSDFMPFHTIPLD